MLETWLARVDQRGDDECWPWLGAHYSTGHGRFDHERAERVGYRLLVAPVPEAARLDHVGAGRDCVNPAHQRVFTPDEYRRELARRRRVRIIEEREDGWWARVDQRGDDECWPWVGMRNATGVGLINGGTAHRAAYDLFVGPVSDGVRVYRTCAARDCVNPRHLRAVVQGSGATGGMRRRPGRRLVGRRDR